MKKTAENRHSNCVHIAGVTGSSPVASTKSIKDLDREYEAKLHTSFCRFVPDRHFWPHVNKDGPNGCWEWTGRRFPIGYGQTRLGGTLVYSHRLSYYMTHKSLPRGAWVLHKCDNRCCCNPDHLFLGDAQANSDDKRQKLRKQRLINGAQAIAIYNDPRPKKEIALAFGCSRDLVENIKNGKAWSDITGAPKWVRSY